MGSIYHNNNKNKSMSMNKSIKSSESVGIF